jgi:hypothetical protein
VRKQTSQSEEGNVQTGVKEMTFGTSHAKGTPLNPHLVRLTRLFITMFPLPMSNQVSSADSRALQIFRYQLPIPETSSEGIPFSKDGI